MIKRIFLFRYVILMVCWGGWEEDHPAACVRSKTVTKAKGKKIINVLKGNPIAQEYSPKFRHWVKQRGFKLMSHHALGLVKVLCLPAKIKVC